jgi:hypothetical protein
VPRKKLKRASQVCRWVGWRAAGCLHQPSKPFSNYLLLLLLFLTFCS